MQLAPPSFHLYFFRVTSFYFKILLFSFCHLLFVWGCPRTFLVLFLYFCHPSTFVSALYCVIISFTYFWPPSAFHILMGVPSSYFTSFVLIFRLSLGISVRLDSVRCGGVLDCPTIVCRIVMPFPTPRTYFSYSLCISCSLIDLSHLRVLSVCPCQHEAVLDKSLTSHVKLT